MNKHSSTLIDHINKSREAIAEWPQWKKDSISTFYNSSKNTDAENYKSSHQHKKEEPVT